MAVAYTSLGERRHCLPPPDEYACSGMYLNVPGVLQKCLGVMVEPLVHDLECHLLCPDHSGSGQRAIK